MGNPARLTGLEDSSGFHRAALDGGGADQVIRFLAYRVLLLVPTLLGVLLVTFLLLYVAPGDPVQAMVGERADPETLARLRAQLRLDDPLYQQFGHYVSGVVRGDLGTSYITRRPILRDLLQRFPSTLRLAGAAMLFAAAVGISIGIYGAWRPHGWADRIGALGAYLGVSFPVYWVGLILILVFAVNLRWLPPSGSGGLMYLILPALTLGMRSVAFLSRMTRAAMQEVLRSDFFRRAGGKGIGNSALSCRMGFGTLCCRCSRSWASTSAAT